MDFNHIIDQIATNCDLYPVPKEWRVVPIGKNVEGRLWVAVDAPMNEEMKDNLRFLSGLHVRELVVDSDSWERMKAFYLSRLGAKNPGTGLKGEIECEWKFKCPLDWTKLSPTNDPWVRHCSRCSRNVVMCGSPDQVSAAKRAGACVAIVIHNKDDELECTLGLMEE